MPEKWGEVSREILQMKVFDRDSSADAIILFNKGEITVHQDFTILYRVHQRIKILNKEGQKLATMVIPFHSDMSKILELKAQTIQPSGEILKVREIFDEKVKDITIAKKIVFPGAEPGSVIEFCFEMLIFQALKPPTWFFQSEYYTLKSELTFRIQHGFLFNADYLKPVELKIEPEEEETPLYRIYKWVLVEIPPFEKEPFMLPPIHYLTSVKFSFKEFHQWYAHIGFAETWSEYNRMMLKNIQKFFDADNQISKILTALELDSLTDADKIRKIYNFVLKKIKGYPVYTMGFHQPASRILKAKEAIQSDKNLLLLYLLRSAGIDASPIVLSSREHGFVNPAHPDIDSFDRLLVYANSNGKPFLLCPNDSLIPFSLVDPENLVDVGYLIKEDQGRFINLREFRKKSTIIVQSTVELDEEGNMTGESKIRYEDYHALAMRRKLQQMTLEELAKGILQQPMLHAEIDSVVCKNQNEYDQPFYITIKYHVPGYIDLSSDQPFMKIPFITAIPSNLFNQEKRKYAVVFDFPEEIREVINLTIPEKWTFMELPTGNMAAFPGAINYETKKESHDNHLIVIRQFRRVRDEFSVQEYHQLKNVYAKCVNYDQYPLILKRIGHSN